MRTLTKISSYLTAVGCVLVIMLLTNCSKTVPETERVTSLLKSGTWKIQTATADGVDQTTIYKNFTITFTDKNFTTVSGSVVWSATGTWTFVSDAAKAFTRDDSIVVGIDNITDTALSLSLTWTKTTLSGGRSASLAGKNIFVFGK